jgi:hypothetical protein
MRRTLLATASLFLFVASPAARADFPGPGPECCSTYPIYLCQPGYLGYPAPPRELDLSENCTGCNHGCNSCGGATACGRITPNPYSCCFYGVTLSNYGLITPLRSPSANAPSRLPGLPRTLPATEKLPKPEPR